MRVFDELESWADMIVDAFHEPWPLYWSGSVLVYVVLLVASGRMPSPAGWLACAAGVALLRVAFGAMKALQWLGGYDFRLFCLLLAAAVVSLAVEYPFLRWAVMRVL
ncbi:hypothetical protein [Bifidobacterium porcinum]|uniref:hypothetical protein n=1 Tax=Bifidobacterium porcinum TaxID=212365 RepID=UPI0039910390